MAATNQRVEAAKANPETHVESMPIITQHVAKPKVPGQEIIPITFAAHDYRGPNPSSEVPPTDPPTVAPAKATEIPSDPEQKQKQAEKTQKAKEELQSLSTVKLEKPEEPGEKHMDEE